MRDPVGIPIMRKITTMESLSPSERRRIKRLKRIFREEGRMPLGTTRQEMKYLYRLGAGRRRYRRRRQRMEAAFERWRAERRGEIKPPPSMDEIFNLRKKKDSPPTPITILLGGEESAIQNEMKGGNFNGKERD